VNKKLEHIFCQTLKRVVQCPLQKNVMQTSLRNKHLVHGAKISGLTSPQIQMSVTDEFGSESVLSQGRLQVEDRILDVGVTAVVPVNLKECQMRNSIYCQEESISSTFYAGIFCTKVLCTAFL
jgi:hypothetical protein